ncbi:MAG TPA: ornithine cyclodeaminase family protein [Hyphomicrobiaceae bacterium]|nr:ornithine cyclodeaminase family protein [Hyphomicrobiaceae bacterium]
MHIFDGAAVDAALSYPALVDTLEEAFTKGSLAPPRHHHTIELDGRPEATLLIMPAWEASAPGSPCAGRYMGLKAVTVYPDNATAHGKPAVLGSYLLMSAQTGETLAVMDATRLTAWRTAAASALASRHLSRPDASRLLMVGAGALAPFLVRAHASVRPIRQVRVWNRSRAGAEALVANLAGSGIAATIADELDAAVAEADIVSAATLSSSPLVHGAWLKPGTHLDCVGAFRPNMRETDDEVVRRARIFVDTEAAFTEAGDIMQPLQAGVIGTEAVLGELADLCRGAVQGRTSPEDITFFKSVGTSIEDLAAAVAVYQWRRGADPPGRTP